ncbi:MAG: phage Gp37/Gp68 family protein [Bacteroidetes bacterium]|nr:phage Gp37/Gp68 family protein [Bacteroidota bacterium]
MNKTKISWTDRTWNPVVGCQRVSPGCRNCYAFELHDMRYEAWNNGKTGLPEQYSKPFTQIQLKGNRLGDPISIRMPQRIFVNSMSDLFHAEVPPSFIMDVFKTMSIARKHTFQILTKRADRMQEVVNDNLIGAYHLPNVWLGVTTENQEQFDKRVPYLIQTSAHVRFISVEPMLGPVSIERFAAHLDWVIIGGESGKRARPMQDEWVVDLILECNQYNVPVFFKQYGSVLAREYDLKDRSGADPSEWPVEWPQEFPVV